MLLTKDEARKLIDRILGYTEAEDCEVDLNSSHNSHTRFANNEITTSGTTRDLSISISVTIDRRSGRVSLNESDEDTLRKAVARAEGIARITPPDPEHQPPLGPQEYPEIEAWHEETARAGAEARLPGVRAVIEPSARKGLQSSGFFSNTAGSLAFGNKAGNFGYHRRAGAVYSATVRTADGTGSGWASDGAPRIADIDTRRLADRAIDKAVASREPRRLEPGRYTVILEPAAVNDLLPLMMRSFGAREADQGFSFLAKRGGGNRLEERVFSEKVTIRSDPFDSRLPALPWSGSGAPTGKVAWVEKGVVKNLVYDRSWAEQSGRAPVTVSNLIMEGGSATLEDLIESTERGLLVTHFWYIRTVNPQTVQLTGLTRDGLFLIEDGRIAGPVMNFRFIDSPVRVFGNVEEIGTAVRTGPGLERGTASIVPPIKAGYFFFSSVSEAV